MFDIVSFFPRAVMQGVPLLFGGTGEIITEKSGNLNLGIPGIMYVGGICGVIGAFLYEQSAAELNSFLAVAIPDAVLPARLASHGTSVLLPDGHAQSKSERHRPCNDNLRHWLSATSSAARSLSSPTAEVPSIALSATSKVFSKSLPFADNLGWFGKMFLKLRLFGLFRRYHCAY